jgi:hypothetical protein
LQTQPAQALRVLASFERALPENLRFLAELVTRTAAAESAAPQPSRRSFARRALGRLARTLRR